MDDIADALYSISPVERDTWVRMAMAIHSELGDAGFELWDTWSRQAESYKAADAKSVWRSAKPRLGGITIASLYHEARQQGWRNDESSHARPSSEDRKQQAEKEAWERERQEQQHARVAEQARHMMESATFETHPYLGRKGFPEMKGLVLDDALLVPMRDVRTGAVQTLQQIWPDGSKKFLPGGRASSCVHRLGRSAERWYCEGYATGLSLQAALRHLYRHSEVVVAFSAQNLAKVAGRGYVVADNDESGAGEEAAKKTGQLYWMPSNVGDDANDVFMKDGVATLANHLREVLYGLKGR